MNTDPRVKEALDKLTAHIEEALKGFLFYEPDPPTSRTIYTQVPKAVVRIVLQSKCPLAKGKDNEQPEAPAASAASSV